MSKMKKLRTLIRFKQAKLERQRSDGERKAESWAEVFKCKASIDTLDWVLTVIDTLEGKEKNEN